MNSVTAQQQADSQHPWIGLASFTEGDREFFAGRGDEIEQLLRLVRRDTLALLYSISGLGKTSLLQAGLFPALRAEDSLPTIIRLDYLEGAAPLATQVVETITAAAAAAKVDAPQPRPGETLWEYFHREDNHFWSPHNDLITPFLAFDQFEEFFTLGRETADRGRRASEFMSELADLAENRPPAALRDDPARAKEFNFKPAPLKILLAMREDYLGDLDYLRSGFRALGQNRLRLLPMGERQAREVIALGASLLAPGAEDRIVKAVAGASPNGDSAEITVAPALLSLVLQELNERRLRRGSEAKITLDLLDVEQEKILEDFYSRTLKDFPSSVRIFVEDDLVTASGHRNSCALDDALTKPGVTESVLNELVNRRLLAYEDRHSTRRVELTHDVLIPVIKVSRDTRRTNEALEEAERLRLKQAAQRRKQHLTAALAGALAIALLATLLGGYYAFFREHTEYYRNFAKRYGFPVGIMQISEAGKLPVSFRLTHKGINWKWKPWWKPQWKQPLQWKPPFRVQAVNGLLEFTTRHSVFPYLWKGELESEDPQDTNRGEKGEQLGLRTVCQWEFVSTREGEIIYERALDRVGRMVYGLVYSPPVSASPSTRSARYVGPDGFPRKSQRPSAAEYVQIHYDRAGWEDRIMYRDAKGLAAAGPDGAFGQSMLYNDRGQLTRVLSLDEFENPVIDADGNSGMQARYDEKGYEIEDTSLGRDLKPLSSKDGWVISKNQYDEFGRLHRTTYHGANGKPVLSKQYGSHGWDAEYDKQGNTTVMTYLGLDEKPTVLADGYATMKWSYDARGNRTRLRLYGVNGKPVLSKEYGHHGWDADYDEHGNETVETHLGLDGKPTVVADGYATVKSTYDARGNRTRLRLYGVNGKPVLSKEYGHHGWDADYDEHGNETVETHLGSDGKPTVVADGYATVKSTYDARGKITRQTFHGVNGDPVLSEQYGSYGWDADYDEQGNQTIMTYLGLDEKPMSIADGYATMKATYDARGNETRLRFYGVNGEPVLSKKYGHHGWEADFDKQSHPTIITYIGPTPIADGYATVKSTYDARGNEIRRTFHGVNGEPVLSKKDGYHGWHAEYDEQRNPTVMTYLGLDEKPTPIADGYATMKSTYDARGNEIRRTFHGVDGERVQHRDGCYGQEAEYDERGNRTVVTNIGLDGKPMPIADGYARKRMAYDSRGNEIRLTFHGVNDEPVQHKDGYYGREAEYDGQGNRILETYLGLDGKPTPIADGYVTMKSTYDAGGKEVRRTFHGVNGELVLSKKDGYYGREDKYDEQGNKTVETYLGLDGKPMPIADGYATVKSTYDARGKLVRQRFYGINGEPVLSKKDGYHGWEAKYDENGNQTVKIYLGKDGKPRPKNPKQLLLSHGQRK